MKKNAFSFPGKLFLRKAQKAQIVLPWDLIIIQLMAAIEAVALGWMGQREGGHELTARFVYYTCLGYMPSSIWCTTKLAFSCHTIKQLLLTSSVLLDGCTRLRLRRKLTLLYKISLQISLCTWTSKTQNYFRRL